MHIYKIINILAYLISCTLEVAASTPGADIVILEFFALLESGSIHWHFAVERLTQNSNVQTI